MNINLQKIQNIIQKSCRGSGIIYIQKRKARSHKEVQKERTSMTKADRIFNATYAECREIVKRHGYEENTRLNNLVMRDDESVCKRTLNAISNRLTSERKKAEYMKPYYEDRAYNLYTDTLNMVENTLKKAIKIHAEIYGN